MVRYCEAIALAMLGRFEEALAIHAAVRAQLADRGGGMALAGATANSSARLALMMGNAEAVEWAKDACRALDEHGEKGFLSTSAGNLARALYAVGRVDEAESWAERAAELGARDDVMTQMLSSQVRAKVLARRGRADEAERLALEAVQMGDRTDMIDLTGDAYADLAEVLVLAKKRTEASAALEQALDRHERKGNLVSAKRVQERLAELRAEAPA